MIRNCGRWLLAPFVLLAFFTGACSNLGGSPSKPNTGPGGFAPATAPEVGADIGEAGPKPKNVTPENIDVPKAFPVFTEQKVATEYVKTMADIHVAATKNRQFHEVAPQVTAVTGAMSCPTVPGQTGKLRQVGDTAKNTKAGKALVIASCYKGGNRSIFFAPYRLYQIHLTDNPQVLEDVIRNAMRDHLAGLTQDKIGQYDRPFVACAAGRMIGGLRDKGYIKSQRANILEVKADDQSDYAKAYRNARDTGNCAPKYLGSMG